MGTFKFMKAVFFNFWLDDGHFYDLVTHWVWVIPT
jgi:hypothetical protein